MTSARVEEARARARARRLYPGSPRFQEAYLRGARAALAGHSVDSCPYPRTTGGWGVAWRLAWRGGFHSVPPPAAES